MEHIVISIDAVYVPVKRRKTLNPSSVESLALSIIEQGLRSPILVRRDEDRYVLVEGLHRLEACRALGEDTILASVVRPRRR